MPPLTGSRRSGIYRGGFVLACFASASPEALVLQTATQASSCIPALDVRKAHPSGPPSVATTRPTHGLVSPAWFSSQLFTLVPALSFRKKIEVSCATEHALMMSSQLVAYGLQALKWLPLSTLDVQPNFRFPISAFQLFPSSVDLFYSRGLAKGGSMP